MTPIAPYKGTQLSLFDPPSAANLLGSNSPDTDTDTLHPNNPETVTPLSLPAHHWYEEKWIKRGDKHHGPYLYERWRENGKLRSRYIGKLKWQVGEEDSPLERPRNPQ